MKAFIEEYGSFLVAVLIGIILLGLLFSSTIQNSRLMARLIPDERNMALEYLKNTETIESSEIPVMDIVDTVVVLIDPTEDVRIDWMSDTIVHKVLNSKKQKVLIPNYVDMKDARDPSKLEVGKLNIIGWDAVNPKVKGDYKITYQYEDPETGYKNLHDLIVCVRRPYIPHSYIRATGAQFIDTGITPKTDATIISIQYQPVNLARQDIIRTEGDQLKVGIFISANGYWGYTYGDTETVTSIPATKDLQEITLDTLNHEFSVGDERVSIPTIPANEGNGYIQIFKPGQVSGKLHSCQISEGDTVRRNLFACYGKTTNSFGLWDTISWDMFESPVSYPIFEYGETIDE